MLKTVLEKGVESSAAELAYKAKTQLGWELEYDLPALVDDMMQSDLKLMTKQQYLRDGGYETLNYFEEWKYF